MKKSELRNIKIEDIKDSYYKNVMETNIEYLISAKVITDSFKSKILVLSFFKKEDKKLEYNLFLDKKHKEYITLCFKNNKWQTGILENILGYYWIKNSMIINEKDINVVLRYFKITKDPLNYINNFQKCILEEKRIERYSKKLEYINSIMKAVPKLPKTFSKWVEETALINSRYIFYKYQKTKKSIKGYCSHCKQEVSITNPKHNKKGICPNCKSAITFKSEGKMGIIQDNAVCCLIQKSKELTSTLVIRYFEVTKIYESDYKNPKLYIGECLRDFDDGFSVKQFEYRRFAPTGNYEWCEGLRSGIYMHQYDFWNIALYTKNLNTVLKNTKYQYSQLKDYASQQKGLKFPVYSYLYCYKKYPFIEYLWKLKLTNLLNYILHSPAYYVKELFNLKGKNFIEILKIDKSYLSRLQKLNADETELKVLQSAYKHKQKITDEELKFLSNIGFYNLDDFFNISKYSSIHRTIKYLEKQKIILNNSVSHVFITFRDYLDNCVELKYDLSNEFVLFPKNLKERHDEICLEFKKEEMKIYNKKIYEKYEELSKLYNWNCKDYIIVVASSADELIKEGQFLHHCVGGYYKKMANGETNILFLRKKDEPNKPFYTIELTNDNNIRQIRGCSNKSATPDVEAIIERFKKEKLKNTSAVDFKRIA